ncbi:hypothetical protein C442_20351 [Haloarcula amylolytica JCM 13557]|uniref:Uncharacterized protein n=2 Tax=Haloarcula amylolytica TaxID=396317 RepID=M0K2W4_9EURY|nr:hypothetical protein C442_20351 [Haloarcula amylolytica JCM 13557]
MQRLLTINSFRLLMEPAEMPYEPGELVHVRHDEDSEGRTHRFGCEVLSVSEADEVDDYTYTLFSLGWERVLATDYRHTQLYPSPRGYSNIDEFLGDRHVQGERLLGKFKRRDLEVIDECLTVVDKKEDATKDWFNELQKRNIDRINSVFAELVLLYHLRTVYGRERVSLNARVGEKDFDLRLKTDEEDVWIEVTKPDFADALSDGFGWGLPKTTQNSIDRKLKSKFEEARDRAPVDAVLVLGIYCEEQINQGFAMGQWLNEEYYDVGEICDGWLSYTHLTDTQIGYQSFTHTGERCRALFDRMVEE